VQPRAFAPSVALTFAGVAGIRPPAPPPGIGPSLRPFCMFAFPILQWSNSFYYRPIPSSNGPDKHEALPPLILFYKRYLPFQSIHHCPFPLSVPSGFKTIALLLTFFFLNFILACCGYVLLGSTTVAPLRTPLSASKEFFSVTVPHPYRLFNSVLLDHLTCRRQVCPCRF